MLEKLKNTVRLLLEEPLETSVRGHMKVVENATQAKRLTGPAAEREFAFGLAERAVELASLASGQRDDMNRSNNMAASRELVKESIMRVEMMRVMQPDQSLDKEAANRLAPALKELRGHYVASALLTENPAVKKQGLEAMKDVMTYQTIYQDLRQELQAAAKRDKAASAGMER